MGMFMKALGGLGAAMDLPGSMIRDTLGGQNPFDQLMSPFSLKNRMMGRDLNRRWGLAGQTDTGMNAAGGIATEMALDPLTYLGIGALAKGIKGGTAVAGQLGKRAAQAGTRRAAGMAPRAVNAARGTMAASVASPVAGAYIMGDNKEGAAWKNYLGMGLMAAPLAVGGAMGLKKMRGMTTGTIRPGSTAGAAGQPYYSRMSQAIDSAPAKFVSQPNRVQQGMAAKTIRDKAGNVIKEIPARPGKAMVGQTAEQQARGYLGKHASQQEIDWVLGESLRGKKTVTRQDLANAMKERGIELEITRKGGGPGPVPRNADEIIREIDAVPQYAKTSDMPESQVAKLDDLYGELAASRAHVKRMSEHGDIEFPDMLIPGGRNTMEVPIKFSKHKRLTTAEKVELESIYAMDGAGTLKPFGPEHKRMLELERSPGKAAPTFPDTKGHFGDDVVTWVIHDQRTMPDGKTARFIQELQSDWHMQGSRGGYTTGNEVYWKMPNGDGSKVFKSASEAQEWMTQASPPLKAIYKNSTLTKARVGRMTPNAPFKGNEYVRLGIKQALDDAIAAGDDYLLLPRGKMVSKAQGIPEPGAIAHYEKTAKNILAEEAKKYGVKVEEFDLPGSDGGKMISSRPRVRKRRDGNVIVHVDLEDVAPVNLTKRDGRWNLEARQTAYNRSYDTYEEALSQAEFIVNLNSMRPAPATVYGIRITPKMRGTIQGKGQALMSIAPWAVGAGAAGGGALARMTMDRQQPMAQADPYATMGAG